MPLFLAFSVRAIYLLSTCLLKRGGGKAGGEEVRGGRRPPGSGIRSSVTNDSSEKFALLLAPLPFQVFQSAKNSQTDIYLEGFTLRYTRTVSFSSISAIGGSFLRRDHRRRERFPIIPGHSTSYPRLSYRIFL